jgi:hypothetical protein
MTPAQQQHSYLYRVFCHLATSKHRKITPHSKIHVTSAHHPPHPLIPDRPEGLRPPHHLTLQPLCLTFHLTPSNHQHHSPDFAPFILHFSLCIPSAHHLPQASQPSQRRASITSRTHHKKETVTIPRQPSPNPSFRCCFCPSAVNLKLPQTHHCLLLTAYCLLLTAYCSPSHRSPATPSSTA